MLELKALLFVAHTHPRTKVKQYTETIGRMVAAAEKAQQDHDAALRRAKHELQRRDEAVGWTLWEYSAFRHRLLVPD